MCQTQTLSKRQHRHIIFNKYSCQILLMPKLMLWMEYVDGVSLTFFWSQRSYDNNGKRRINKFFKYSNFTVKSTKLWMPPNFILDVSTKFLHSFHTRTRTFNDNQKPIDQFRISRIHFRMYTPKSLCIHNPSCGSQLHDDTLFLFGQKNNTRQCRLNPY